MMDDPSTTVTAHEEKSDLRGKRKARNLSLILGVFGGLCGGIAGQFVFSWIVKQGFYAIILPGTLAGIGCGALSRRRSIGLGVFCALLGLGLGIVAEWRFAPFIKDKSLTFFLCHLSQLKPFTLILILLGGVLGFWFGVGREGGAFQRHGAKSR